MGDVGGVEDADVHLYELARGAGEECGGLVVGVGSGSIVSGSWSMEGVVEVRGFAAYCG